MKLIIGLTTYNWINNCFGVIHNNPRCFDVMILKRDVQRPIMHSPRLCFNAIEAQRKHDLNRIGNKLGIRKIMNLNLSEIDSNALAIQLTLHCKINNVDEVYCEYHPKVSEICKHLGVDMFSFSMESPSKLKQKLVLEDEVFYKKQEIGCMIVGASEKYELEMNRIEEFY